LSLRKKIIIYFLLIAGSFIFIFPLWWMFIVSLSDSQDAIAVASGYKSFELFPDDPQWKNYPEAIKGLSAVKEMPDGIKGGRHNVAGGDWSGFLDSLSNSIVVTFFTILGTILSSSLVGYGFARLRYRGKSTLFFIMLATMMVPGQVTMIPLFLLFKSLGWVNTFYPLIIPSFFGSAYFIFLFRQYYGQIGEDIFNAATLDGASHIEIWWHILIPISKPVVAITAIFTFLGTWNDFMTPLIYLNSRENYTIAVALNNFRGMYWGADDIHLMMAASLVTMIPCVLLFVFAQKYFIEGLNVGGMKG
jgi:multiple sugar transport system permease protein